MDENKLLEITKEIEITDAEAYYGKNVYEYLGYIGHELKMAGIGRSDVSAIIEDLTSQGSYEGVFARSLHWFTIERRLEFYCDKCGSNSISVTSNSRWCVDTQEWVTDSTTSGRFCNEHEESSEIKMREVKFRWEQKAEIKDSYV